MYQEFKAHAQALREKVMHTQVVTLAKHVIGLGNYEKTPEGVAAAVGFALRRFGYEPSQASRLAMEGTVAKH